MICKIYLFISRVTLDLIGDIYNKPVTNIPERGFGKPGVTNEDAWHLGYSEIGKLEARLPLSV